MSSEPISSQVDGEARLQIMAPLARAYARSVPEHPADAGLFGPRSLVWRVNRDRSFPLAGMRSQQRYLGAPFT